MSTWGKVRDPRSIAAGRDTGRARLPGLTRPNASDPAAMQRWAEAVSEHLEVREGSRGNDAERVVTQREFAAIRDGVQKLQKPRQLGPGEMELPLGGGLTATVAIEQFSELIRNTRLYRELLQRLDDPERFDRLPEVVRQALKRSLIEEAQKLGASITRTEVLSQERFSSLAMRIDQLTAGVGEAQSGVREVAFASAEQGRAQAGQITQLEASLGNYYQDGTPGRASLEQQMLVTADSVEGLEAQYTLKVQAGGALAGFGIAAEEVNGVPSSAFIINADKFAIVAPNYNGGLSNSPNMNHIPFGVDAQGIYLNNNVYVQGSMRVDTGGKTLSDGLRGSVSLDNGAGAWSDASARNKVWQHLGNSGNAPNNNHLVIGDTVRMGNVTRTWNGSSWLNQGVFINGNMVVAGSLGAREINTNGLIIRDQWGNPIFGAGSSFNSANFPWLGALAREDSVQITNSVSTSQVRLPDGSRMRTSDFVNKLSKIGSGNISTFMDGLAVTNAYIGNLAVNSAKIANLAVGTGKIANLAVETIKIRGEAVTIPRVNKTGAGVRPTCNFTLDAPATVIAMGTVTFQGGVPSPDGGYNNRNNRARLIPSGWGSGIVEVEMTSREEVSHFTIVGAVSLPAGSHAVYIDMMHSAGPNSHQWIHSNIHSGVIVVLGAKK